MRRRIQRSLGGREANETELTSLNTWLRVGEAEQRALRAEKVNGRMVLWMKEEGKDADGPFCAACWNLDKGLVRLTRQDESYSCLSCYKLQPRTLQA